MIGELRWIACDSIVQCQCDTRPVFSSAAARVNVPYLQPNSTVSPGDGKVQKDYEIRYSCRSGQFNKASSKRGSGYPKSP